MLGLHLIDVGVGAGVGLVGGAFVPAIGRKIKAIFVKDSNALKVEVAKLQGKLEVAVAKAAAKGAAEVAAAAKKI
jgi:hypothetical protein